MDRRRTSRSRAHRDLANNPECVGCLCLDRSAISYRHSKAKGFIVPDDEVAERYSEARQWNVKLRIWSRKELENYLLVPEAISRYIASKAHDDITPPNSEQVGKEIDRIAEEMREEPILDSMATVLLARDKKGGLPKANKAARVALSKRWTTRESRWATAPGKEVIARLSQWSQREFGVGLGSEALARELHPHEIDPEVIEVIKAIIEARAFRRPFAMPR
jgi:hypothetical protein